METGMLADARAAELDTLYSLYFPDAERVTAAAVVGCVCLDHLTCTECARILGEPFVAIELAARKKQRTDTPSQLPRVDVGVRPGRSAGGDRAPAEGFGAAISGMADPVRAEGFEAAISGMAARLGLAAAVAERAKEVFRKMEEARAWPHHGRGWAKDRSKGALYAACVSIACRNEGSPRSLRELALTAAARKDEIVRMTALIRRRLGKEVAGQARAIGMACASSYVRRFGALVGLGEAEEAAALGAARRLEEGALDVRHTAESVAAAVVCLALERAGAAGQPVKDVAAATGITHATIFRVSSSLRPHADLLFG